MDFTQPDLLKTFIETQAVRIEENIDCQKIKLIELKKDTIDFV